MTQEPIEWINNPEEMGDQLGPIYRGDRGLEDLHDNDVVLRLWLPVTAKAALFQVARELQVPVSTYLREQFVVFLYGQHELLRMKNENTGLYFKPEKPESTVFYQRSKMVDCIPGLGKNIIPIKVRLPSKIKNDLEELSRSARKPLGQFVREVLVANLLGHKLVLSCIQSFTANQEQLGNDWEENHLTEKSVELWSPDASDGKILGFD